jgi:hypothetical protein
LGIRLIAYSTIFYFLSWKHLKCCPFVGCTRKYILELLFFSAIIFYVEVICIVFSLYVVSIRSFCVQGFLLYICLRFISIESS